MISDAVLRKVSPCAHGEFDDIVAHVREFIRARPISLLRQIETGRMPPAEVVTIVE